jgi:hypothetical protein
VRDNEKIVQMSQGWQQSKTYLVGTPNTKTKGNKPQVVSL